MKYIGLFLLMISFSLQVLGQKKSSESEVYRLINVLDEKHYFARSIDDKFSEELFYMFIGNIDEHHLQFLKSEIQTLSTNYKLKLDDELKTRRATFISVVSPVYRGSLARAKKILEGLKSKEMKIVKDESYTPCHFDSLNYAANEAELMTRWERYIKLKTLIKEVQNNRDSTQPKRSTQEIYLKVIAKTLNSINVKLQESKSSTGYLYYEFASCIPALFDAHSSYMSYNDFQNFQSMLSTENYKFGIVLEPGKLGGIEVVRITPGSPAWKSGKFKIGDVVTHLKWQNAERIDLSDLELGEVHDLLDVSNNLFMEFTLKSPTGEIEVVSIKKEKTSSLENSVKGYVLTGADQKKVGYIYLPSFYTLLESDNMLGCANDVAKELVKLKEENIEGLIFDLRSNGGGSLKEGLELAGIFVNEGTLAMQRMKDQSPMSMKDWNRGMAYSGPMVVLVNGHSASASELMASTLQDYNRAVIIGTNTYGKATGQELFPLNPQETQVNDSLKSGYVSVTVLKLYRVTGKSNQQSGMTPDIILPDPFVNVYENESKEPYAIKKDTVTKKGYYQPLKQAPIANLRKLSEERISKNENFTQVKKLVMKDENSLGIGNNGIVLTKEAVKKEYENYEKWLEGIKKHYYAKTDKFSVKTVDADATVQQLSEDERSLSEYSMKRIQSDITLEESYLILKDLINNP